MENTPVVWIMEDVTELVECLPSHVIGRIWLHEMAVFGFVQYLRSILFYLGAAWKRSIILLC
jgi:hypothetical protein